MKTDLYTKCILTLIAALLIAIVFNPYQSVQAQSRNRMMKVHADYNNNLTAEDGSKITGTVDGFTCWGNGNCFAVWH